MNRFERLLQSLVAKIESVRVLCSDIPVQVAEKTSVELAKVVKALRDPQAVMTGRNVGYVAAEAEEALQDLRNDERRFLVTLATIDSMRARIGNLHPHTRLRMIVSDEITKYDELRLNHETRTAVLREAHDDILDLMDEAEVQSNEIKAREAYGRVLDTFASGVVGSIQPVRRGRRADKREMDRQLRASMKGEKRSDDSKGHSKKRASA